MHFHFYVQKSQLMVFSAMTARGSHHTRIATVNVIVRGRIGKTSRFIVVSKQNCVILCWIASNCVGCKLCQILGFLGKKMQSTIPVWVSIWNKRIPEHINAINLNVYSTDCPVYCSRILWWLCDSGRVFEVVIL